MSQSKAAHAAYTLRQYHARRKIIVARLGGRCVRCGRTTRLHIDHIDPDQKTFEIAERWSCAAAKLDRELEGCQLLCVKHHKEKHATKHGMERCYRKGCRCAVCTAAQQERQRRYRENTTGNNRNRSLQGTT